MSKTVFDLINIALANPGQRNTYWAAQLPLHGFPFGNRAAIKAFLVAGGVEAHQDSGIGVITVSGVNVTDHGAVYLN